MNADLQVTVHDSCRFSSHCQQRCLHQLQSMRWRDEFERESSCGEGESATPLLLLLLLLLGVMSVL